MLDSDKVYSPLTLGRSEGVIRWPVRLLRLYWSDWSGTGAGAGACEVIVPSASAAAGSCEEGVAEPDDEAFFEKVNFPFGLSLARNVASLPSRSFNA